MMHGYENVKLIVHFVPPVTKL